MNPDLARLQPYPFEKLAQLKRGVTPPAELPPIALSIGEPKDPTPGFIHEAVLSHLHGLSAYPSTKGLAALREAIADWLGRRFDLCDSVDPERQVLPVNGTREALFAFAQAVVDRSDGPLVLMPNPFYQIYEGAALLAGAEPRFLDCRAENGFRPDFDRVSEADWRRCQLLYLCSPGNPAGAVLDIETLQGLIGKALKYNFIIAADECYSEIYAEHQQAPPSLLQAARDMGLESFRHCVVFHSLSKRSNAPGLRSGFVAGDADIIECFLLYRTYHGCAMPLQHQAASQQAWADEQHVRASRERYRQKFDAVLEILNDALPVERPQGGFYLWPETPIPDTDFARGLFEQQHLTVLPGRYLSRDTAHGNPGANRIRMALVPALDECVEAAKRIHTYIETL